MKQKIMVLPVDGRPVVRGQLATLGAAAGWEILLPPKDKLGFFRETADRDWIKDWILTEANAVDGFVFSLDTLIYGGLVASRICEDSQAELLQRLDLVSELSALYPDKPIYGFLATMRISNNNVNEEEKLYWDTYGEMIWQWSYYTDKYNVQGDPLDQQKATEAKDKIPESIQKDYLATRERNYAIAKIALEYVQQNKIQRLILPQDDNALFGFNLAESRELQKIVQDMDLASNIIAYSGADEVAWTLISRMITVLAEKPPTRFFISWHDPQAETQLVARYEDKPVGSSIAAQVAAVNGVIVDNPEDADICLCVHSRGQKQGDWAMVIGQSAPEVLDENWKQTILQWRDKGKLLSFVDLTYATGGDSVLIDFLMQEVGESNIVAYGAWNTASNSIGSAVAQSNFCNSTASFSDRSLLITRLVDDYFYQSHYRQVLRTEYANDDAIDAGALKRFADEANTWLHKNAISDCVVENIYLPWDRSFEIGFEVTEPISTH